MTQITNPNWTIPQNSKPGGLVTPGILTGIEKITCGNSRSQLKKKWNF